MEKFTEKEINADKMFRTVAGAAVKSVAVKAGKTERYELTVSFRGDKFHVEETTYLLPHEVRAVMNGVTGDTAGAVLSVATDLIRKYEMFIDNISVYNGRA
ncbi:MAG: hypothetical protein NC115_12000 [Bacteroidales bacterium]|nr:hypothetical protein [Bacteroidales bacterium]